MANYGYASLQWIPRNTSIGLKMGNYWYALLQWIPRNTSTGLKMGNYWYSLSQWILRNTSFGLKLVALRPSADRMARICLHAVIRHVALPLHLSRGQCTRGSPYCIIFMASEESVQKHTETMPRSITDEMQQTINTVNSRRQNEAKRQPRENQARTSCSG